MFGYGVTTYIVLPTTSGAASWPLSTPVEKVQATLSCLTFPALISVEAAEPGARVVFAGHDPLAVLRRLRRDAMRGGEGRRDQ